MALWEIAWLAKEKDWLLSGHELWFFHRPSEVKLEFCSPGLEGMALGRLEGPCFLGCRDMPLSIFEEKDLTCPIDKKEAGRFLFLSLWSRYFITFLSMPSFQVAFGRFDSSFPISFHLSL
jgi:hypothetical protein